MAGHALLADKCLVSARSYRAAAMRPAFSSGKIPSGVVRTRLVRKQHLPVCSAAAATAEVPVFKGDILNGTYYPTGADASNANKRWYIIDAKGKTLGRLATLAATYVRGKNSPTYTPSMDMGAYVVVINCEQVQVTGRKFDDKTYFQHVNPRPGSFHLETFKQLQQRLPERILERAVHGMLPKNRLGNRIKLHLKVFKGDKHPHEAQNPVDITHLIDKRPCEEKLLLAP